MSYKRAEEILPLEIIELIQQYVEGENIYIPKKPGNRAAWGESTSSREELKKRDSRIFADYMHGISIEELAAKYYLSKKSIQRIIRTGK